MLLADLPLPDLPFVTVLTGAAVLTACLLALTVLVAVTRPRRLGREVKRLWLSRLLYAVFLLCVGVLAASSFGTIVRYGHMSGYALLAHVATAGVFVFLLLAIAFAYLPRGSSGAGIPDDNRWWVARWSCWVMIVSGILAAGTMFLSMLPILNTGELLQVAMLHRYAGLVVTLAACMHLCSLVCVRLGLR